MTYDLYKRPMYLPALVGVLIHRQSQEKSRFDLGLFYSILIILSFVSNRYHLLSVWMYSTVSLTRPVIMSETNAYIV